MLEVLVFLQVKFCLVDTDSENKPNACSILMKNSSKLLLPKRQPNTIIVTNFTMKLLNVFRHKKLAGFVRMISCDSPIEILHYSSRKSGNYLIYDYLEVVRICWFLLNLWKNDSNKFIHCVKDVRKIEKGFVLGEKLKPTDIFLNTIKTNDLFCNLNSHWCLCKITNNLWC